LPFPIRYLGLAADDPVGAAVPEPSALYLVAPALAALLAFRRRA